MNMWLRAALALLCASVVRCELDPRVQRLKAAQEATKDGIIVASNAQFDDFASGKSRPYSLVAFCTASHLKTDASTLRLKELRDNFAVMTTHYRKKFKDSNRVFFLEIDFARNKEIFHRLNVESLPWVLHISPGNPMKSTGMMTVHIDDRMKPGDFGNTYPWTPANFADFVKARAHVDVGTVHVPTLFNHPLFLLSIAVMLAPLAWLGLKIYYSSWIGHPLIWTTAVLLVFWFAVSGGMHNIIRGIPLMVPGKNGKVQWYTNSQGQLGAEGFAVGGLYLMFALSSTTFVFLPKWFSGKGWSLSAACALALFVASFALVKVVDFYTFKTGYRLRMYLFEGRG